MIVPSIWFAHRAEMSMRAFYKCRHILPEKYHSIIQYNPVYYIVEGYRDSLIYNTWFWEKTALTLQFWIIALFFFFAGAVVFRKLRPHFADVL